MSRPFLSPGFWSHHPLWQLQWKSHHAPLLWHDRTNLTHTHTHTHTHAGYTLHPGILHDTKAFIRGIQHSLWTPSVFLEYCMQTHSFRIQLLSLNTHTHTHTHTYTHTLAGLVHTCCRYNLGVNKGFLLRFNDVFTLSGALIVTQNRELAQGSAFSWVTHTYTHTHTHTHTHWCYIESLTLAWQSVSIRVGKVMSPTLLTWTPHPLFLLSHPLHVLVKRTCM